MLFGKSGCNPNDCYGLKAGGISQQLPKMGMVGALKLILDQHPCIGTDIFT